MCERCDALHRSLADGAVKSYNEQAQLTNPDNIVSLDGMTPTQVRFVGNLVIGMIAERHGTRQALEMVAGSGAVIAHIQKVQHQAATS